MVEQRFEPGDVVFREGEPSDRVGLIRSGLVEVVKSAGEQMIALGRLGPGEHVGEMGVLEERPRATTVRAVEAAVVDFVSREEFLERVSSDREMSLRLLRKLSERLHRTDDALARQRETSKTSERAPVTIRIEAANDRTRRLLPDGGVAIPHYPYLVGRRTVAGERAPPVEVDLTLEDPPPFRLSRVHFSILQTVDGYAVSDTMSTLGTVVNGRPLGEHFAETRAGLHHGTNEVTAGGLDSSYRFRLVVG